MWRLCSWETRLLSLLKPVVQKRSWGFGVGTLVPHSQPCTCVWVQGFLLASLSSVDCTLVSWSPANWNDFKKSAMLPGSKSFFPAALTVCSALPPDHPRSRRVHDYFSLWLPCWVQSWVQLCWVHQLCHAALDRLWQDGHPSKCLYLDAWLAKCQHP